MKQCLLTIALCFGLLFALSAPAFADVIWEPYDDKFYDAHRAEMEYHGRGYLANGPEGYVTLYESPQADRPVVNVDNGALLYVEHIWPGDGESWGVLGYRRGEGDSYRLESVWARMDQMALVYDNTAFVEDHGDEFAGYDGSGDHLAAVCLYAYPGGTFSHVLEEERDYMPFSQAFTHLYTDESGMRWTFIGYYMGRNNSWACIDDPLNENLGTERTLAVAEVREGGTLIPANPPAPEPVAGDGRTVSVAPGSAGQRTAFPLWALPAGLVALVCAATALLIRRGKK